MIRTNLSSLYSTRKNANMYDIKIDDDFNYYLFVNNKFIKTYKYKKTLDNYVRIHFNVQLMF